nr:hypothetical protein [uncultured Porphyromonas sp.]
MQGAEDEDEGSVLTYVTEARIPKATQQIAFVQQSPQCVYFFRNRGDGVSTLSGMR